MADIKKLMQKQKEIEAQRKMVNAQIRKALEEEKTSRYVLVGKAVEEYYKTDPHFSEPSTIITFCAKHFGQCKIDNIVVQGNTNIVLDDDDNNKDREFPVEKAKPLKSKDL